jgi:hypothetical protein
MPTLDRAPHQVFGTAHRIDCRVSGLFAIDYNLVL